MVRGEPQCVCVIRRSLLAWLVFSKCFHGSIYAFISPTADETFYPPWNM